MTETIEKAPSIHEAMAAVMTDVPAVPKSERNTEQNFNFRGVDAVTNAVGRALRTHNIVVTPQMTAKSYRDVQTRGGKTSREVLVDVTYRFHGPAGDYRDVTVPGESIDVSDKGTAKAMSVAYRIALIQTFCLPTDDTDPDHEYHERETASPAAEDDPDQLRRAIAEEAERRKLDISRVAADFKQRAQCDITAASAKYLQSYLGWLRTNGMPDAQQDKDTGAQQLLTEGLGAQPVETGEKS